MSRLSPRLRTIGIAASALVAVAALWQWPLSAAPAQIAQTTPTARPCRVTGFVKNGELALPGASITVRMGDRVVARTSTDLDGSYVIALAPGTYTLRIELSVFAPVERPLTVGNPPCDGDQAVPMALASRTPGAEIPSPPVAAVATAPSGPAGVGPTSTPRAGASGP